jgi:DMSO/TMAO reductase YedYZ molybdopterin-dependent catalytic subunit
MNRRTSRRCAVVVLLAAGLLLILAAILCYTRPWDEDASDLDPDWGLTLVGRNGEETMLSLAEIRAMPAHEGLGGFFTSVGVVNGPYEVKGVTLQHLCGLVGGLTSSDLVFVSSSDGYSSVLDHDQVEGNLPAYDPENMREVQHEDMEVMLIYEQDGMPLSHDYGKPLRLAVVGTEGLLTEGFYWVKWVDRIEVVAPS